MSEPAAARHSPTHQNFPAIGFGTWQLADGKETEHAVKSALEAGYRLIDTAKIYGNEESVGRAIRSSSVARKDITLTTKLWNDDQGYDSALAACQASLDRLGLSYIDLYLIHWPASEARHESWRALTELQQQGKVRQIGVSNYSIAQLEELMKQSNVKPAVNQIEFHTYNYEHQRQLVDFCQQHDIIVEAYSPLARGRKLDSMTLEEIASNYRKSVAQIMLRWCLQHGTVPLPKSSSAERITSNYQIFDFSLNDAEMEALNSLSL